MNDLSFIFRQLFVCYFCFASSAFATRALAEDVLGPAGRNAFYTLATDIEERPQYERQHRLTIETLQLMIGPAIDTQDGLHQWLGLQATRTNGNSVEAWLLVDGWPTVNKKPHVARYLFRDTGYGERFLEYVHEATGEVVMPRLDFWQYAWPTQPGVGPARLSADNPEHLTTPGNIQ